MLASSWFRFVVHASVGDVILYSLLALFVLYLLARAAYFDLRSRLRRKQ